MPDQTDTVVVAITRQTPAGEVILKARVDRVRLRRLQLVLPGVKGWPNKLQADVRSRGGFISRFGMVGNVELFYTDPLGE